MITSSVRHCEIVEFQTDLWWKQLNTDGRSRKDLFTFKTALRQLAERVEKRCKTGETSDYNTTR